MVVIYLRVDSRKFPTISQMVREKAGFLMMGCSCNLVAEVLKHKVGILLVQALFGYKYEPEAQVSFGESWVRQLAGLGKSGQVQKTGNPDMQASGCWARQVSGLGKSRQVQKWDILAVRLLAAGLGKCLG